jgi:hypothetical protein
VEPSLSVSSCRSSKELCRTWQRRTTRKERQDGSADISGDRYSRSRSLSQTVERPSGGPLWGRAFHLCKATR